MKWNQIHYDNQVTAIPYDACVSLQNPTPEIQNKVVLVKQGGCLFDEKVLRAQQAGAAAVIIGSTGSDSSLSRFVLVFLCFALLCFVLVFLSLLSFFSFFSFYIIDYIVQISLFYFY